MALLLSTVLVSGCARIKLRDQEWCGDKGKLGAVCFHTLKTDTRTLDKDAWAVERFGQVCTDARNFVDWKAIIEKLCSVSKRCDYDTKQAIKQFFAQVRFFQRSERETRELEEALDDYIRDEGLQ